MVQIEFDFNQKLTTIQANLDDFFKDVINKYVQKVLINPDKVSFFANGAMIKPENKVESQMNSLNKNDNKMKVLVISEEEYNKSPSFIKSKEIICTKC